MDFAPLNVPLAPAGSPVTRSAVTSRTVNSSESSSVEKGFSSVLHRVRSEEGKGGSSTTEDVRSSNKTEHPPRFKETKGLRASSSHIERSDTMSDQVTNESISKNGKDKDEKNSKAEPESSQQGTVGSASEEQGLAVLASAIVVPGQGHVTSQTELDSKDDVQSAKSGDESVGGSAKPAVQASVLMNSSLTTPEPTESHFSDHDAVTPPQSAPEQKVDASMTQKKANSQVALVDNKGLPIVVDQSGNKATEHVDTRPVPIEAQAEATISSLPEPGAQRVAQVSTDTMVSDVKSTLVKVVATEGKNLPPAASPIDQPHAFAQPSGEQEDPSSKPQVVLPHEQYVNDERTEHISEWWADQHGRQPSTPENQASQMKADPLPVMNGQTVESFAVASQSQATLAPTTSSGSPTSHTHPPLPVVELSPQPLASTIRSVVVDVAQPDLGHVNIRVAMMNDSVHAHFSTDRTEVGQFLINGQDRLQTTLQASGLDMGQFRVDIDRQNGGRSFQQGLFQEQGQSGHQGFQGGAKEQARGWSDDTRSLLQGRLNLVA